MAAASDPHEASERAGERRRGRRRKREQARAEVLRSALALADAAPFCDLTVDEIAAGAGLSRSAFYTRFADKHDLLLAALAEVARDLDRTSERWWRGEGPPAERVRRAIEAFVSIYAEQAALLRVVTEVSTYDDQVRSAWLAVVERFIAVTAEHVRDEQRAGLASDLVDPRASAEALVWMLERCCHAYIARGQRDAEDLVIDLTPVWTAALYPGVVPAAQLRPGSFLDEPDPGRRLRPE